MGSPSSNSPGYLPQYLLGGNSPAVAVRSISFGDYFCSQFRASLTVLKRVRDREKGSISILYVRVHVQN